ncbi:PREDICTED: galanin receptor type 1-like [Priapulus caudatus]|uniref:Galanin receptor type 1-like n=1 Tax=Priapulus caudatus TaxID=37621 RepID=A0ABM1ETI9_PRICU|nr:PREDICTED: galanin receptor type 1-like [Priapulus caudatus]
MASVGESAWTITSGGNGTNLTAPLTAEMGTGPEVIIIPLVFLVIVIGGCFGNSLVIVVILKNRDQGKNTTNLFILNLSFADLLFLLFCVPFHAWIYTLPDWIFGEFVCKVVHFVQYCSMLASVFTLVAMSMDRCLAIVYPLRSMRIRTPGVALLVCGVIWLMSCATSLPWLVVFQITSVIDGGVALEYCADVWTNLDHRAIYLLMFFVLGYAVPFALMLVLNLLMVRQLWIFSGPNGPTVESIRNRMKVTRLVISVVVVFGICWLPSHVATMWFNFGTVNWSDERTIRTVYIFRIFTHMLSYVNSSLNPLIYALVSGNFRKDVKRAFTRKPPGGALTSQNGRSMTYKSFRSNERVERTMGGATNSTQM